MRFFAVEHGLGGIGEVFERGGITFHKLLNGLISADGGFEGDFLRKKKGGTGIDDGASGELEHFVESKVGKGGGFASLTLPEQCPKA